MKTKAYLLFFSSLLFIWLIACSQEKKPSEKVSENKTVEAEEDEPAGGLKLYGIKSGMIEYKYSGNKTGTGTLYFDRFGTRSAMYTDAVENGEKRKGWVISFDDQQYIFDPSKKEGWKMKNPMITALKDKNMNELEKITAEIYGKMGMTKTGTEEMLGKPCERWEGKMGKVLTRNGMLMFMEMKMGAITSRQEATSVQTNIRVGSKYFELPKDITFTDMPGFGH